MPYLIDGHNLIARLPDLDLADPDDEAKLVLRLRGFAASSRRQCIVVFDQGLPGGQSALSTHSVKVIFATAHHTTADRIIQERIRHTRDAANWTVVSADQEVLAAARQHGMKALTSGDFATRLLARPAPPDRSEAAHVVVPPQEVDEWLTRFAAAPPLPPAEAPRPPRRPAPATPNATAPEPEPGHRATRPAAPAARGPRRPLESAGKYDDDVYLSDADIAGWLHAFSRGPQPAPTPPARPRPAPVRYVEQPADDEAPPAPRTPAPKKAAPRPPAGKFDDETIPPDEVEAWLRRFNGD
jgi:hypothetical protein